MKATRLLILFCSLAVPFAYFNHSDGWNQGARLAELHAIVLQGTLRIDRYHEITGDKALIDGHYYSEKAPAIVLLALPAFAATVWVQQAMGIDPDSPGAWRVSQWIATAASVGVIAALGGVAFYALLAPHIGATMALVSTYAVFLGTIIFPYATAMFAHAGTIGLLSIALWAAVGRHEPRFDYVAGVFAGLAVASEYPAIIPCAALGLYLLHAGWPRAWRFGLGLAPAVILILANNYAITGSPLQLGYGSNPAFPRISAGNAFGFNLPDPEAVRHLLWGEYRSLSVWSPVLLMAVPGLVVLFRTQKSLAWLIAAVFVLMMVQVSSFYSWFGGYAVGPRYLAPAIPFLAIAAAFGIKRWPIPGIALAVVSLVLMGTVTAVAIDPPEEVLTPLRSFYLVRLQQGRFVDNLGTLSGLSVPASLILIDLVVLTSAAWLFFTRERPHAASDPLP